MGPATPRELRDPHARTEEAEGVARAGAMARRGTRWAPRSVADDMDTLIAVQFAAG